MNFIKLAVISNCKKNKKALMAIAQSATITRANVLDLNCLTNVNYVRIGDTILLS